MQSTPDTGLSPTETRDLHHIAGIMIPPSEDYGVPGADDAIIFADIVQSLGRDLGDVRAALAELANLTAGSLAGADAADAEAALQAFYERAGPAAAALSRVVLQCYYRDERVLSALGLEPRPPFPKGHTLEQGDWSLLDAVRDRPKLWRDAP